MIGYCIVAEPAVGSCRWGTDGQIAAQLVSLGASSVVYVPREDPRDSTLVAIGIDPGEVARVREIAKNQILPVAAPENLLRFGTMRRAVLSEIGSGLERLPLHVAIAIEESRNWKAVWSIDAPREELLAVVAPLEMISATIRVEP